MIKLKNVKVFDMNNPNFTILNKEDIFSMINGLFIINEKENIIGYIKGEYIITLNDCLYCDVYIRKEQYKEDICFKSYEVQIDELNENNEANILKVCEIMFGEKEKEEEIK